MDLGRCTWRNRPDDAIGVYERVLERDPNNLVRRTTSPCCSRPTAAMRRTWSAPRTDRAARELGQPRVPRHLRLGALQARPLRGRGVPLCRRPSQGRRRRRSSAITSAWRNSRPDKTADARKNLEAAVKGDQVYPGKDEARLRSPGCRLGGSERRRRCNFECGAVSDGIAYVCHTKRIAWYGAIFLGSVYGVQGLRYPLVMKIRGQAGSLDLAIHVDTDRWFLGCLTLLGNERWDAQLRAKATTRRQRRNA